jgi:adenylate cyclase
VSFALENQLADLKADLREAKEKLHLFEYAVDAAKDGGAFTADGWTMINSKLHSDLLVAKEQIKGAVELLREVEWAYIEGVGNECPHCKRDRDVPSLIDGRIGHAPDCKLKAWLERRG